MGSCDIGESERIWKEEIEIQQFHKIRNNLKGKQNTSTAASRQIPSQHEYVLMASERVTISRDNTYIRRP
jgi:hypothetical protein